MRNGTPLSELAKQREEALQRFNLSFPIIGGTIHKGGITVRRVSTIEAGKSKPGKRRKITGLSRRALNRLAFTVFTSPVTFRSIMTLTYGTPFPKTGVIIKRQLKGFLQDLSRWRGDFQYCWWLEFQTKREAPHFHLLLSLRGPSREELIIFSRLWTKWAFLQTEMRPEEYEKVFKVHSFYPGKVSRLRAAWEEIRKREGAKWYILKYASKFEQKAVPGDFSDVGRFWGVSRGVPVVAGKEVEFAEEEFREFLSEKGLSVATKDVIPKRVIIPNLRP